MSSIDILLLSRCRTFSEMVLWVVTAIIPRIRLAFAEVMLLRLSESNERVCLSQMTSASFKPSWETPKSSCNCLTQQTSADQAFPITQKLLVDRGKTVDRTCKEWRIFEERRGSETS